VLAGGEITTARDRLSGKAGPALGWNRVEIRDRKARCNETASTIGDPPSGIDTLCPREALGCHDDHQYLNRAIVADGCGSARTDDGQPTETESRRGCRDAPHAAHHQKRYGLPGADSSVGRAIRRGVLQTARPQSGSIGNLGVSESNPQAFGYRFGHRALSGFPTRQTPLAGQTVVGNELFCLWTGLDGTEIPAMQPATGVELGCPDMAERGLNPECEYLTLDAIQERIFAASHSLRL
jgi:hypothetical protein